MSFSKRVVLEARVTAGIHLRAGVLCEGFVSSRNVAVMLCKRRRVK